MFEGNLISAHPLNRDKYRGRLGILIILPIIGVALVLSLRTGNLAGTLPVLLLAPFMALILLWVSGSAIRQLRLNPRIEVFERGLRHTEYFIQSLREGKPSVQDATKGHYAAAAAHLGRPEPRRMRSRPLNPLRLPDSLPRAKTV